MKQTPTKSVIEHVVLSRNGPKSNRIFEIVQIWPILLNSEGSFGHFLEIWYVWGHFFGLFKAYLLTSRDIFDFKHILLPENGPKSSQILNTVQFWPIQPYSNCSKLLVLPFFGKIMCSKTLLGAFQMWYYDFWWHT